MVRELRYICSLRCVKNLLIRSFSGPYFPAFDWLWRYNLCIQSDWPNIQTKKTPNTDTVHGVKMQFEFPFFFHVLIFPCVKNFVYSAGSLLSNFVDPKIIVRVQP